MFGAPGTLAPHWESLLASLIAFDSRSNPKTDRRQARMTDDVRRPPDRRSDDDRHFRGDDIGLHCTLHTRTPLHGCLVDYGMDAAVTSAGFLIFCQSAVGRVRRVVGHTARKCATGKWERWEGALSVGGDAKKPVGAVAYPHSWQHLLDWDGWVESDRRDQESTGESLITRV